MKNRERLHSKDQGRLPSLSCPETRNRRKGQGLSGSAMQQVPFAAIFLVCKDPGSLCHGGPHSPSDNCKFLTAFTAKYLMFVGMDQLALQKLPTVFATEVPRARATMNPPEGRCCFTPLPRRSCCHAALGIALPVPLTPCTSQNLELWLLHIFLHVRSWPCARLCSRPWPHAALNPEEIENLN